LTTHLNVREIFVGDEEEVGGEELVRAFVVGRVLAGLAREEQPLALLCTRPSPAQLAHS
jgi:hypothetical protein